MSLSKLLDELQRDRQFMANVSAWEILPAQTAEWAPVPQALAPVLHDKLSRRGVNKLYSHQRKAVDCALDGKNVAVVTPTASGKTLCYNLPVFQHLLSASEGTALYLFPTKALAHDQLQGIAEWLDTDTATGGDQSAIPFAAYDGDTPTAARANIRRASRLIITNPDMLHTGVLPYHARWDRFFAGLRFVVIDEMHTYRGVFGSHVANVLRRLKRIAAFYGSRPQFILTSATIANPEQLAEQLIEEPVEVVDRTGAPRGEKHIILYNPPMYDEARGLRRSSVLESNELATRLLTAGLQTIVFGRSRLTVEVLLTYLRDRISRISAQGESQPAGRLSQAVESDHGDSEYELPAAKGHPASQHTAIRGYRGGYLPEERRIIEAGLRTGDVRGVVTTNALELGIDIGRLEAAVICGYPGTIASTWQQMGRAGRSTDASLAVVVTTAGALDQFIASHPDYLLQHSPEHAFINPDNLMLLVDQLRCAAFELPFQAGESFGRSPFTADVLALLAEQGELYTSDRRYLWQGEGYPAHRVGLRSAGNNPVRIQSQHANGQVSIIGEVDAASAPMLVHQGAVYIHEGQSYIVESLDLPSHEAWVTPTEVDYYTDANISTEIDVLSIQETELCGGAMIHLGELQVTSQVKDYREVKRYTHENIGVYPLDYPPQAMETSGYWIEVTDAAQIALIRQGQWRDAPNHYGPNWQEQRRRVRAKYGYRCAECGTPESRAEGSRSQHDVHHIVPFRTFGYVPGHNEAYKEANRLSNLLLLCRRCHERTEARVRTRGGLDGLAYALRNLAPLHLMCDRSDIGVAVMREGEPAGRAGRLPVSVSPDNVGDQESAATAPDSESANMTLSVPQIYIYERVSAGLGFSKELYDRHEELLSGAEELIRTCGCHFGCPACVGPVLLGAGDERPLLDTKKLALSLVRVLRHEEEDREEEGGTQRYADTVDFIDPSAYSQ